MYMDYEDIVVENVQKQIDVDNERLLCSVVCVEVTELLRNFLHF
jgi:hypothetical protein